MSKTAGPSFKCKKNLRRINKQRSRGYKTVINNFYVSNQFLNINVSNTNINQYNNFQAKSDLYKESRFSQPLTQLMLFPDSSACGNPFKLFSPSYEKLEEFEHHQDAKKEVIVGSMPYGSQVITDSKRRLLPFYSSLHESQPPSSLIPKHINNFHSIEKFDSKTNTSGEICYLSSADRISHINRETKGVCLKDITNSSRGNLNSLHYLFLNSPPHVLCAMGKLIQIGLKGKRKKWKKNKDFNDPNLTFPLEKDSPKRRCLSPADYNLLSSSGTSTPFRNKVYDKRNWDISPIDLNQEQEREKFVNSIEEFMGTDIDDISPYDCDVAKQISKLVLDDKDNDQNQNQEAEQVSKINKKQSINLKNMTKSHSCLNGLVDNELHLLSSESFLRNANHKSNYSDDIFESLNSPTEDKSENINKHDQLLKFNFQEEENVLKLSEENETLNQLNDHNKHDKTSISSACDFHSVKSYNRFDNSIDSNNSFNFSFTNTFPGGYHEENTSHFFESQSDNSCLDPYIRIIPGKKWRRSLLVAAKKTLASVKNNHKVDSKTSRNMRFSFDPQNNYLSSIVKPSRHTCASRMSKLQQIKENSPLHEKETKKGTVNKLPLPSINVDDVEEIDVKNRTKYEEQAGELDFTFAVHQEVANILQKDDLNTTFLSASPNSDDHKKFAEKNVLSLCSLTSPVNFCDAYSKQFFTNCKKIGEGLFGEVFCYIQPHSKHKIALKIIPIEGDIPINFSPQKTYSEVFSEMCIAFSLSSLKNISNNNYTDGFCSLLRMTCLKGKYPDELIAEWNEYDKTRGSENDSPAVFDSEQLYIALEMLHGGEPLESYHFSSARQSYSVLLQVIHSLAVAEISFEFEHRDLHWGNVLISKTYEKKIKYVIDGDNYYVSSFGKKSTIIDYTLSRIRSGNYNIYNDIGADDELFEAYGDYQFDIYRSMRDDVDNNWKLYVPKSNVRWIHYLATKCLEAVHYRAKHNLHKSYMQKIKCLRDKIVNYASAVDIVKDLKSELV